MSMPVIRIRNKNFLLRISAIMKVFVIFSVLLGAAYANECFKTLQEPCGKNWKTNAGMILRSLFLFA